MIKKILSGALILLLIAFGLFLSIGSMNDAFLDVFSHNETSLYDA